MTIETSTALDQLVAALLEGTRSGAVRWRPADARGRAFIAKRPSGTVVVQSGLGPLSERDVRLVVKDRTGATIDEVTGSSFGASGLGRTSFAEAQLRALMDAVRQQLAAVDSTVRTLAAEFQTGDR